MTYPETLDYLFNSLPMYHRVGKAAYKADITNTVQLMEHLGNPHRRFRSIHVAGTNGKGSCSHSLCSILMQAGYKVGLYTSPHLVDFRERIRINGQMIPQDQVVDFVQQHRDFMQSLDLSFFEMTVGLAFDYFAQQQVDVAVIEVGMGGRLDSTNVITPDLSVITNIGLEHTQFLGDTLDKIAFEKAGIIKSGVPVVVGETLPETRPVFVQRAADNQAPITIAQDSFTISPITCTIDEQDLNSYDPRLHFTVQCSHPTLLPSGRKYTFALGGDYQRLNLATILQSVDKLVELGYHITSDHVQRGLEQVVADTGLLGRWDVLDRQPLTLCETAHNADGVNAMIAKLAEIPFRNLYLIYGCVNDKDVRRILRLLPRERVHFIFTNPSVPRQLPVADLLPIAESEGMQGSGFSTIAQALEFARREADPKHDLVLVTGSIFLVADAFALYSK